MAAHADIPQRHAPAASEAARVAAATATGCHDDELDAWEAAAAVHLPAEDEVVPWFLRVGERPPTYRSM
ncbi:hypothetical protein AB0M46_04595 [Dactylosporangium sp. NPDC051485]|uniref:hypothetical protein n=1 Tax=Dactylosporangium sp. NPDC051485 TaxID=3154846 RepID=UPI00344AB094